MTRTWRRAPMLALGSLLLLAAPVAAGGWATATLTDYPDGPVAGEETTIGVELKQHDVHPISWATLSFSATELHSGAAVTAEGRPEGPTGRYVISVTFPREGQWDWSLQIRDLVLQEADYPTINVARGVAPAPAAVAQANASQATATQAGVDPVLVMGIVLLSFLGGALTGTLLRRTAPAIKPISMELPSTAR